MISLKVTKEQRFTLSLEDTVFKKPQGVQGGRPPSRFRVKVELFESHFDLLKAIKYCRKELHLRYLNGF